MRKLKTTSTTSGAEKLKQLKELLDEGILTSEEYDEKKAQILSQDLFVQSENTAVKAEQPTVKPRKPFYKKTWFIILIVIAALVASIAIFDACTVSYKEAQQAFEESARKHKEAQDRVNSLKDELDRVNSQIDEYYEMESYGNTSYKEIQDLERKKTKIEEDYILQLRLEEIQARIVEHDAKLTNELGGSLGFKFK